MQLTLVTGCLLLNVHQWCNKNLVPMCAKVISISISYTCWATYNNQQTTPGQEVHKFYPFQPLFWLTGSFKNTRLKWQILPLVWVVQRHNAFSFSGLIPWPGALPRTPLGALPPDPRHRLALRARHESYSRLLSTPLFSTWRRPCSVTVKSTK